MTILNLTKQENLYTRSNLKKFLDVANVPQQDWYLVVNEAQGDLGFHRYQLIDQALLPKASNNAEQVEEISAIDLETATPSDIVQIGSLLESKHQGI